jgi:hypothetical protein
MSHEFRVFACDGQVWLTFDDEQARIVVHPKVARTLAAALLTMAESAEREQECTSQPE